MDETALLRSSSSTGYPRSRSSQQVDLVDDECSTDSGCSSGGCSTGSAEILSSRRGSVERDYLERSQAYRGPRGRSSTVQERLKQRAKAPSTGAPLQPCLRPKASRSWSPDLEAKHKYGLKSPSHSQSPSSETPSSSSDSVSGSSLGKRSATARGLRKAFQSLKIATPRPAEAKKSQKRILRSPVAYTYVKGLSGLPTQRIPRNVV